MSDAVRRQQQVVDGLEQLSGILQRHSSPDSQLQEIELIRRQLTQLHQLLRDLSDRQQGLLHRTSDLETERLQGTAPSAAQAALARQLSAEQRQLVAEADRLARDITSWTVFQTVLEEAGQQMAGAADRMELGDTGSQTQRNRTPNAG